MKSVFACALTGALALAGAANATTVIVDAMANSSTGGVGANTGVNLTAGQHLTVSVNPNDLWNAGALPRWSDANGLTHDLLATGSDESGQAAGTLIGTDFGTWTQDGFSAPFGALVGKIGSTYRILGTSFNGTAWDSGQLVLYYWDSFNPDNTDAVTVDIASAIPEPATWAFMVTGLGMAGAMLRRRRAAFA